jgi:hypothetical protein
VLLCNSFKIGLTKSNTKIKSRGQPHHVSFGSQCFGIGGITYNDTIIDTKENLLFSNFGVHFSQWGYGSAYGSLGIRFKSVSLSFDNYQKCGIPCSSGVDFNIKKD